MDRSRQQFPLPSPPSWFPPPPPYPQGLLPSQSLPKDPHRASRVELPTYGRSDYYEQGSRSHGLHSQSSYCPDHRLHSQPRVGPQYSSRPIRSVRFAGDLVEDYDRPKEPRADLFDGQRRKASQYQDDQSSPCNSPLGRSDRRFDDTDSQESDDEQESSDAHESDDSHETDESHETDDSFETDGSQQSHDSQETDDSYDADSSYEDADASNYRPRRSSRFDFHGYLKVGTHKLTASSLAGPGWDKAARELDFNLLGDENSGRWICEGGKPQQVLRRPVIRQAWRVYLVYNTWAPFDRISSLGSKYPQFPQLVAHWGVAFALMEDLDEKHRVQVPYRVYSMDFSDMRREHLVVQSTWHTKNKGWQQVVYRDEFHVVDRKGECSSITMYFAEAEIDVTAQILMENFIDKFRKAADAKQKAKKGYSKRTEEYSGRLFHVLSMNCQDYATYLFDSLLYQRWNESDRLDWPWNPQHWLDDLDDRKIPWMPMPPSQKWNRLLLLLGKSSEWAIRSLSDVALTAGLCVLI